MKDLKKLDFTGWLLVVWCFLLIVLLAFDVYVGYQTK